MWNSDDEYTDGGTSAPHYSLKLKRRDVGAVIGRGGATIRNIESETGAKINIRERATDRSGDSDLNATGSLEAVRAAKRMILETLGEAEMKNNENRVRRGGFGGDGGRGRRGGFGGRGARGGRTGRNFWRSEEADDSNGGFEATVDRSAEDNDDDDDGPVDWQKLREQQEEYRRQRVARLPPLVKNLYRQNEIVAATSPARADRWRLENNNISIRRIVAGESTGSQRELPIEGDDFSLFNPITEFAHGFGAYPDLMREIERQGFAKPSPIQAQAWPVLLSGRDLIGIAQTGTGKTLAFLLPALIHIESQPTPREERSGPNVLVLAPTRELALQIKQEADKFEFRGVRSVCVYGGTSRKDQINSVEKGAQIVIATPGRLNDLIEANVIDAEAFSFIVLDEADRMLDMGFDPQIRKSLVSARPDRQTVMTSATWPLGVRHLAETYLTNPIRVVVGTLDLAAVGTVAQSFVFVEDEEKFPTLLDIIKAKAPGDRFIIFCTKKVVTAWVSAEIGLLNIEAQAIYGGLDQSCREEAIEQMRNKEVDILIATDIASRGLDIDDVTHVINFDFPVNIEEYVHRVGRTGRAGRKGNSITFISRNDWSKAAELIKVLEEGGQEVPEELKQMAERFENMKRRREANGRGGRGGFRRGSRF